MKYERLQTLSMTPGSSSKRCLVPRFGETLDHDGLADESQMGCMRQFVACCYDKLDCMHEAIAKKYRERLASVPEFSKSIRMTFTLCECDWL